MSGLWDGDKRVAADRSIVAAIGECMIEIVRAPDGTTSFGYAGDTLNTSVYLARLGLRPSYVTALGTDPFSDAMLAFWTTEGVASELVTRRPDQLPGLYIVTTDQAGERRFHYWRDDSAARTLFTLPEDDAQLAALDGFPLLYWSGISLAILRAQARARLLDRLARLRAAGTKIAFDPNFRPRLWPDVASARTIYAAAFMHADIVFTSVDDEAAVFGGGESALIERHRTFGVRELIVKNGNPGSRIVIPDAGVDLNVDAPTVDLVVDTTAAGDSFAAAYIAARWNGRGPEDAALNGHRLAGAVCGVRGAIIPRERMPETA
jgi:2-dehydro-3-deoxygluconokinase